jgi:pimeloyl-ACP methyl ester carboxylesterase
MASNVAAIERKDSKRIGGVILLNAVGIDVPGHPVTDVSGLSRLELIRLASHDPELVMSNAPPPTPERIANVATNTAALAAYDNGAAMMASGLRERLAAVTIPVLVLWGESDGIASIAYGQAYADAFADGQFELVTEAGHLPHIEQPARTLQHIERFIAANESDKSDDH